MSPTIGSFCYLLGVSDPSKGIYACGAHSDYGMMTLLATDGVMGLQVIKPNQFFLFYSYTFLTRLSLVREIAKLDDRYAKIRTPSLKSGNMYRRLKGKEQLCLYSSLGQSSINLE